jgi:hypothetical protein
MGQTADQIKQEIDQQREQLGENLQQLETKVKETVDWRSQFEQRPMAGVGLAFGAGFVLSMLMPSGDSDKSRGSSSNYSSSTGYNSSSYYQPQQFSGTTGYNQSSNFSPQSSSSSKPRSPEMNEITETLENIRGAVMGLAATRLRSFLAEAVPGFQDEYEQAREKRGASDMSKIDTEVSNATSSGSSASFSSGTNAGTTDSGSSWSSTTGAGTDTSGSTPKYEPTSPSQSTYRS